MWKQRLLIGAFIAAFLSELWYFIRVCQAFLVFPPISDSGLYTAVARGMLNGLRMYVDLFESKPPIIFWLVKLSLLTHPTLYNWIQILLLLSLVPLLAWFAWRKTRNMLTVGCAALLGITLAFETVVRTFAYQPEGFAAVVCVYIILLFAASKKKIATVLCGILIGIAAMIKEPFVFAAVLGLLVFCRSWKDIGRIAVILCVGFIVSMLILLFSGEFYSYFSIYLPEMIFGRAVGSIQYPDFGKRAWFLIPAPLWVRSLTVWRMLKMMAIPMQSFLFPAFFIVCLGLFSPIATGIWKKRVVVLSFAAIAVAIFSAHQAFILYELVSVIGITGKPVPWDNPIILRLLAQSIAPVAMVCLVAMINNNQKAQLFILAAILGMFCVTGLVAFGGDGYGQYLGFGIPAMTALAMYCIVNGRTVVLSILSGMLVINAFMPGKTADKMDLFAGKSQEALELTQEWGQQAKSIDAIMDACGYPRYFLTYAERAMVVAFTKHSPYQIYYGNLRAIGGISPTASDDKPSPYFAEKYMRDLSETKMVVMLSTDDPYVEQAPVYTGRIRPMDYPAIRGSYLPKQIIPILKKDFTLTPPTCANGISPAKGIKVFFRQI